MISSKSETGENILYIIYQNCSIAMWPIALVSILLLSLFTVQSSSVYAKWGHVK